MIARCADTADVVAAVNFARERDLVVAVRCGGHSVAGLGTCDDGIVIDLSGSSGSPSTRRARTARAGGGVLWGEFDAATQAHGLHTPGGRVTTTGIGGFTTRRRLRLELLQARTGLRQPARRDGRARRRPRRDARRARARRAVLGVPRRRREPRHRDRVRVPPAPARPDRARGAGPVRFERAPEVLRGWRDLADAAPDELSTAAVVLTRPARAVRARPSCRASRCSRSRRSTSAIPARRRRRAAAQRPRARGRPDRADALHRLPGGARRRPRLRACAATGAASTCASSATPRSTCSWRARSTSSRAGAPLNQAVIFRIGQAVAAVPDETDGLLPPRRRLPVPPHLRLGATPPTTRA